MENDNSYLRWEGAMASAWADIGRLIEMPRVVGAAMDAIDEYRHEARRCRIMASAMMRSMDTNGVVAEFNATKYAPGGFNIVVCAPNLDESNLGDALLIVLREMWSRVGINEGDLKLGSVRVTGTEGDPK